MKSLSIYILASSILLAFTSAFAQVPATDSALLSNPIYEKDCAKCHGKTATGRRFGGPSLVSEKVAAASAEDLRNIISNGKGRMPKYGGKLPPAEIDNLIKQIQALHK